MDPLGRRDEAGMAAASRRRCPSPTRSAKQVADSGRAWIFTSATLAVGRDFSLYQRELGPRRRRARRPWESPFDYDAQALLYVPRALPPPNSREHTEAVVAAALPRAEGQRRPRVPAVHDAPRAERCARELADCFAREGLDWPLLVQGEGSRSELLARFRELGNAVLLGSAELLGRRRRSRRGAVGGRHRQAAVRTARRSAARRAARAPARRRRQSVLRLQLPQAAIGSSRAQAD